MRIYDNEKEEAVCGTDIVETHSELDKIIDRLKYMTDYSGSIEQEISNHLDVISGNVPEPNDDPKPVQIDSKLSDINYLLDIMDQRIAGFQRSAHRLREIA